MIGIKPEIVKRGEANRIGVLIGRKSFGAPGDGACVLGNIPRRAAISGVSQCSVVREPRLLRWHVKADVSDVNSSSHRHGERLDGAIEVLVIERVLIVPDTG